VVAILLVYQPAWRGEFIWDDDAHVTRPELRTWQGLYRIWFELGATQQYYPLLHSAFWVEHNLWGDAPLGYHLVNIFLHAAAVVLAALVLRRLAIPGAYLAAAIFALHPVQVESVAWITELKNTLSAVFYLGAILLYLHFEQSRTRSSYGGALGLFVLGLLSKTVTATLPAALLVIFWWQRGRLSWRRDVLPLLPFFVLGTAAGVLTAWVERKLIGAEGVAFELTIVERSLIAGRVIWFYLGKLFWPGELIFVYPRWHVSQGVWWQYLFPLAAILLLVVLFVLRRRWRGPLAGVLFFVGTLFPVLGFCNVFPFIYSFVADHFQYLASLGIITLVSAGVGLSLLRWGLWGQPPAYVLCGITLTILALLTWRQSRMYTDIETLYNTTIIRNPECWMAHIWLGSLAFSRGHVDEAIVHYQKALEIKPDSVMAHNNLGAAMQSQGRMDDAIAHFRRAVEIDPRYGGMRFNLANALASRGRINEAIAQYQKTLEMEPHFQEAHGNLGDLFAIQGKLDEAVRQYLAVLSSNPSNALSHTKLGMVLIRQGKPKEAEAHFRQALHQESSNVEVDSALAVVLQQQGKTEEAIAHYRKALEIKPDYSKVRYNLGTALASKGRFDEAISQYQQALQLQPDNAKVHINLGAALQLRGKLEEAIAQVRRALEIEPSNAKGRDNLGKALASRGQFGEAIFQFQQALKFKPDDVAAHSSLAWLLATCPQASMRNGTEAIEHAQRANQLFGGRRPDVLDMLAAAYAEAGRFPESLVTARKALELAVQHNDRAAADGIRLRIALYEVGKPYHQPLSASAPAKP
jgi:tetratricopeptide (TPR) repeat protein